MSTRKAFAHVENNGFKFSLTKEGLMIHKRNCSKKSDAVIPFDQLLERFFASQTGNALRNGEIKVGNGEFLLGISEEGVTVRRFSDKTTRVESWKEIANRSRCQPLLFPGVDPGPEPEYKREIDKCPGI